MSITSSLLSARNLSVTVPGRRLVDGLTLNICGGTITAVLGRNGSGKTLCLMSLAGLRKINSDAEILLGGSMISELPRRDIARRIGFLAQDPGHEVAGTVRDFVALGLYPWQDKTGSAAATDLAHVTAALHRLDLANQADQEVISLSGGERRRLDLALLLVQRAPLWLLDEPANHLDPAQQAELLGLLQEHRRAGGAALVTMHDPSLAADIADDVLLLQGDGSWQIDPAPAALTAARLSTLYRTPMALAQRLIPQAR